MTNWRGLDPYKPIPELYVERQEEGGALEMLGMLESQKGRPLAIFGPAGSGKSSELARLSQLMMSRGIALVLIPIDARLTGGSPDAPEILAGLAAAIFEHPLLSEGVASDAEREVTEGTPTPSELSTPARDLFRACWALAQRSKVQDHCGVLIDGLEKFDPVMVSKVLEQIALISASMSDDRSVRTDFAVVIPPAIGIRSSAHEQVDPADSPTDLHREPFFRAAATTLPWFVQFNLQATGAVFVDQALEGNYVGASEVGRKFLCGIASKRLRVDASVGELGHLTFRAIELSGGLPRTFLLLLQGAARYAAMNGRTEPTEEDLLRSASDQARDLVALASNIEGAELTTSLHGVLSATVPLDVRIPLLEHGLLLEYRSAGGVLGEAPLLRFALGGRGTRT